MQGVKKATGVPNPHLYNSLAVLAGEMGFVEEARAWFKQGTSSVRVITYFNLDRITCNTGSLIAYLQSREQSTHSPCDK